MIGLLDNGSIKKWFGCRNFLISLNEAKLKGTGLLLCEAKLQRNRFFVVEFSGVTDDTGVNLT